MNDFSFLNDALRRRAAGRAPYIIGVGGGVAVGKSTFARALTDAMQDWPERPRVESVATDGFLFPNATLAERGLSMRKGFPESYDVEAFRAALAAIREGARVPVPRYSHVSYDVDPRTRRSWSGPTSWCSTGCTWRRWSAWASRG